MNEHGRFDWFAIWTWPAKPRGRRRLWLFGPPLVIVSLMSAYYSAYLLTVRRAAVSSGYDFRTGRIVSTPLPGYTLQRFGYKKPCSRYLWSTFRPAHAVDCWLRPELWRTRSHVPTPEERERMLSYYR